MTRKICTIVFDLDETLGHFSQLYTFLNLVQGYLKRKFKKEEFFEMLDLFPEFLRPDIINVLKRIVQKLENKECYSVMIYTNNNGPKFWCEYIIAYFHYRLNYKIFGHIISAFKIGNKKIELRRTSNEKSYKDFINCTQLPDTTQVCFIDDQHYSKMEHENVVYIHINPYIRNILFRTMAIKYYNNNPDLFNKQEIDKFINYIELYTCNYKLDYLYKNDVEEKIDYLISQRIIKEIEIFFQEVNINCKTKNRTQKNRKK